MLNITKSIDKNKVRICIYSNLTFQFIESLHDYALLSLVLKCVLFETTKKGLINSPEMYGHSLTERPNIYVCFLAPPPKKWV